MRTKRQGQQVLVKLAGQKPGEPPQWIAIDGDTYWREVECHYESRDAGSSGE
jgi:hypothetical protein